jgi:hypothetical protein
MMVVPQARNSQEFHRRRAEAEMEKAIAAAQPSIAMLHLELAKRHREMRNELSATEREAMRLNPARAFNRTDKEG